MLEFSEKDQKAKWICLHYATLLSGEYLIDIIEGKAPVNTKEQALALSRFFWKMLEASANDQNKKIMVQGDIDLQYWMGRSMNIISTYLSSIGYKEEWEQVFDES
ncbi:MAG: hypothetical protein AAGC78_12660 [Cellvibrio sp.]|uniref:hypothetical protein n=1 Tax=Cellvibrio sp. TaxID=1965322 RepID=UPI0031A88FC2